MPLIHLFLIYIIVSSGKCRYLLNTLKETNFPEHVETIKTFEIDIRELTASEAKYKLERLLLSLPNDVKQVKVTHGYNNGQTLLNMVRHELKSRKIKQRILSSNKGITILLLKCYFKTAQLLCE